MIIEIFADNLEKQDIKNNTLRIASRAIIINEGKILLEYAKSMDLFMLPGGGLEKDETLKACVKREVLEETGYLIKPIKKTVSIKEYFPDESFENNYFICDLIDDKLDKNKVNHTEEEKLIGIELKWVELKAALTLLDTYESHNEFGTNIMTREFIAIINSL